MGEKVGGVLQDGSEGGDEGREDGHGGGAAIEDRWEGEVDVQGVMVMMPLGLAVSWSRERRRGGVYVKGKMFEKKYQETVRLRDPLRPQ